MSFVSVIQVSSLESVLPSVFGLIFWTLSHGLICGGERPHTDSFGLEDHLDIWTAGGHAYGKPNTTAAALRCCSFYLFSSHIFCTVRTSASRSVQRRCLSLLFNTTVTWLPQDSVARQQRSGEGVKTKGRSGKALNVLSYEAIPMIALGAIICSSLGQRIENWCWQWSSAQQYAWDIVPLLWAGTDVKSY